MLSLGIGAAASLFTIVQGALLHPFPYRESERFVVLNETFPGKRLTSWWFSVTEYLELERLDRVFETVSAAYYFSANLTDAVYPEHLPAVAVTANTFAMVGASAGGRTFLPEEDRPGGERVVVLGHRLWQRRYGGDPGVVGQTVKLNGESYSVVGVLPPRFLIWGGELWIPLALDPAETDRTRRWLGVGAYLRPGVSLEQAKAELKGVARQIEREPGRRLCRFLARPRASAGRRARGASPRSARAPGRGGPRASHRLRQRGPPHSGVSAFSGAGAGGPRCSRRESDADRGGDPLRNVIQKSDDLVRSRPGEGNEDLAEPTCEVEGAGVVDGREISRRSTVDVARAQLA